MRHGGLVGAVLAVVTAGVTGARAEDWQVYLEKPLSPGSVALVVEHAADARVATRWSAALKDPRPGVRAAGARAINVTARAALLGDVAAALAVETDVAAAAEEAEALAALGGRERDPELLAAVAREPRFAPGVALAVARSRGRAALTGYQPIFAALTDTSVRGFVRLATRADTDALTDAGAVALRERRPAMLAAVFAIARDERVALDDGVPIASLQHDSPEMRALALWHLVLSRAQPTAAVAEAVANIPEAKGQSDHAPARLAHEMVRRRLGGPAREDPAWLAGLGDPDALNVPFELRHDREALQRLSPSELAALSRHLKGDPKELARWLKSKEPDRPAAQEEREVAAEHGRVMLRMLDGFPPGLFSDVMEVSGCGRGQAGYFYGGQVAFASDGRPRRVTLMAAGDVRAECAAAVRALLFLSLAERDRITDAGHTDMLVQPLDTDVLSCQAAPPPAPVEGPARRVGGSLREPKKVRNIAPTYPAAAQNERVSGIVVLEAVISSTGCVSGLEVVRSRDTRLDLAALFAVARWRYTPTLLDGVPVPVIMTVTVNFRLR